MLTLCKLQMHQGLSLHTIHVSGKQRIAKGTDGLSRGLMTMVVMTGLNMLNYVQLHLDALERQGPTLKDWILNWFWIKLKFLEPRGWLCEDNTYSTYIWSPPPAAAEVAWSSWHTAFISILTAAIKWSSLDWWQPTGESYSERSAVLKICCLIFTVPNDSDVYFDCWFVLSLKQTSSLELQRNANAAAREPDAVLFATVSS